VELKDVLIEISNSSKEDVVMAEAKDLCKNALEDFEFLISLCIWYKILDKINWVSQVLQKEEIDLENAIIKIKELILFFENLRENGFLDLIEEGRELEEKFKVTYFYHIIDQALTSFKDRFEQF
jgi:hypothetical protein